MPLHCNLRAENRFDARRLRRLHKFNRPMQIALVRQGNGRQFITFGQINVASTDNVESRKE